MTAWSEPRSAGGGAIFHGSLTVAISTSDPDDQANVFASLSTAGFIGLSVTASDWESHSLSPRSRSA